VQANPKITLRHGRWSIDPDAAVDPLGRVTWVDRFQISFGTPLTWDFGVISTLFPAPSGGSR